LKKRDQAQIIKSILEAAMGEGVTITALMNKAALSSEQMKQYLSYCVDKGLLDWKASKKNKCFYLTTPKGVRFIRTVESISDLLSLNSSSRI
jgi:predicted transcriptional regulator